MAHKTLISGTAYDITGGRTLIDGTGYDISKGRTLVSGTGYDISFILPPAVLDLWGYSGSSIYNRIECITYAGGRWVVGGTYYDGTNHYARIAYATSLDGPWIMKDLWSSSGDTRASIHCIAYASGYWVVGGLAYNSGGAARIAYATAPDGTWTIKDLWTYSLSSSYDEINCITYAGGYWVVGGAHYDGSTKYACIAYATAPDGTWTTKDLWHSIKNRPQYEVVNCIIYANGYWVVGGNHYSGSVSTCLAYASSTPDSSWTIINTPFTGFNISCITYANGYWVAGGNSGRYITCIAYAASLDSVWTTKDLWSGTAIYSDSYINCITYADGYWVAGGKYQKTKAEHYARIAYATAPDGTWTTKDLWSCDSDASTYCITHAKSHFVIGGMCRNANDKYSCARMAYAASIEELGQSGT